MAKGKFGGGGLRGLTAKKEEEAPQMSKAEIEEIKQSLPRPLLYRRFCQIKKPDIGTLALPGYRTNRVKEAMKKDKGKKASPRVLEAMDTKEEPPKVNLALMEQKRVNLEGIYSTQERESDIQKMKTYFETMMNPMQRLAAQPDGARLLRKFVLAPDSIH